MCKTIFLLLTALCLFAQVQAQILSPSVLNSTGGVINQSGGAFVEYSIGEMAVVSLNLGGNEVGFTQGFLQPTLWSDFIINSTHESFDEKYTFKCFPNPVSAFLTVETSYQEFNTVQFTNVEGQLLHEVRFDYSPIDCTTLLEGTYFVRIFSSTNPESKTFKLFKL